MSRKPDVDLQVVRRIAEKVIPGVEKLTVKRAEEGVSTQVYRLRRDRAMYFLRVAEGPEAGLAPEVLVHRVLRERGVRVPEIVHFEPFNDALGRAVMITTEIPGCPISWCKRDVDIRAVLVEAGRDLAIINSLEVDGFGWIRRKKTAAARLEAGLATYRVFAIDRVHEHLGRLRGDFLTQEESENILRIIARYDRWFDVSQAHLAHGDLDASHIYQQNGQYSGIIDFGEIQGADQLYDLGHFALHDGEALPDLVLPHLLEGFREITPLPPDHERKINLSGLLIGVRALARSVNRPLPAYQDFLAESIRRSLRMLAT